MINVSEKVKEFKYQSLVRMYIASRLTVISLVMFFFFFVFTNYNKVPSSFIFGELFFNPIFVP